jgi:hypothetical protein
MRTSPLPAAALAALLVLSGCSGLAGLDGGGPSQEAFPDASAIDELAFQRHAALLANTSFTVRLEKKGTRIQVPSRGMAIVTPYNISQRVRVEPGASQYLSQPNGTLEAAFEPTRNLQSMYSDGNSRYRLLREDGETTVLKDSRIPPVFNESSDEYLWQGWSTYYIRRVGKEPYNYISENVTYERLGTETFDSVEVMRYEATGVDALADSLRDWPPRESAPEFNYTDFSVTLLLDADGVIRYFRCEADIVSSNPDWGSSNVTLAHTVTDVGGTDVEKPDWVGNATAGS